MPPDSDPIKVHPLPVRSQLTNRTDLIRQAVVSHVAIIGVMKRFGAAGSAHRINFHHNKAQFGDSLLITAYRLKTPGTDAARLRTGVQII